MSDKNTSPNDNDNDVRRLLNIAGRRAEPPSDMYKRVYEKVQQEWQELPESQPDNKRKISYISAIAASFLIAALTLFFSWKNMELFSANERYVAELIHSTGKFEVIGNKKLENNFLLDGTLIHTSEKGRIELQLHKNTQVRLDVDTQVSFRTDAELLLHSGRIYVDAPGDNESVRVITPFGPINDIGTQFIVEVTDQMLEVAVRVGTVNIEHKNEKIRLTAQPRLAGLVQIDKKDSIKKTLIKKNDTRWHWIHLASKSYRLESSNLHQFLVWATRESGLTLKFENEETRLATQKVRLHGSIDGMTPGEAIETILLTTEFRYELTEDDELTIFRK